MTTRYTTKKHSMTKVLCKVGMHRPLRNHVHNFVDKVSCKSIYTAKCPCGQEWLTDSSSMFFGFKCKRHGPDNTTNKLIGRR